MIQRKYHFLVLFILAGCATSEPFNHPNASGHYTSDVEQCALYARRVSGVELYGAADSWWQQAAGHYQRGNTPQRGAVLVLKRTSKMRSGHVAVVRDILDARHITITHTNWGDSRSTRHIVYESMRVEDVSPANDWTRIRLWNDAKNVFGFPYAAYGFIYPR